MPTTTCRWSDTSTRASSRPIVRQARRLNTNSRYLHETAIELAERLIATTGGALDAVMFVNSGIRGERRGLANRACRDGGSGGITTDFAYHGITDAIHDLTPEEWSGGRAPEHVRTWRPPDVLRGFDGSARRLRSRARGPPGCGPSAGRSHPRRGADERRDHRPVTVAGEPARSAHARRWRPLDRRRSPVRTWPHRCCNVGLPAVQDRAGHPHGRQAHGQRDAGGRGHHPSRSGGAILTRWRVLQHVRRQPGRRGRGSCRAGCHGRRARD